MPGQCSLTMPVLRIRAPRKLTAGAALFGAVARVVPGLVAGEAAAAGLRRGSLRRVLLWRRRRQGAARYAGAAVLCPQHVIACSDAARSQGAWGTHYLGCVGEISPAAATRNLGSCARSRWCSGL